MDESCRRLWGSEKSMSRDWLSPTHASSEVSAAGGQAARAEAERTPRREPKAQWQPVLCALLTRFALGVRRCRGAAEPTAAERELLARYVECSERADAEGLAALMHEDVRFSMPPTPGVWTGRSTVVQGWIDGGFGSEAFGSMRCVVTRANGQPAVAGYVRKPGDAAYEPLAIDVLRVQDGVVTEIVTFGGAVFEHFNLPATLSAAVGTR